MRGKGIGFSRLFHELRGAERTAERGVMRWEM